MNSKQLSQHLFTWAYDQTADQVDEEVNTRISKAIEMLALDLPDLRKAYQRLAFNPQEAITFLEHHGTLSRNQKKFVTGYLDNFKRSYIADVLDLTKKINSVAEHMDNNPEIYEKIDQL